MLLGRVCWEYHIPRLRSVGETCSRIHVYTLHGDCIEGCKFIVNKLDPFPKHSQHSADSATDVKWLMVLAILDNFFFFFFLAFIFFLVHLRGRVRNMHWQCGDPMFWIIDQFRVMDCMRPPTVWLDTMQSCHPLS